jgi:hypothetical protein
MPSPSHGEIAPQEGAEWPFPPLDERLHKEEGLSQGTSAAVQVPLPGALPPAPPHQTSRPGPAEVRCALAATLVRLTVEHANLEGFVRSMDLTSHPRAGEALQALSYFEAHLRNAWRCVGSALSALEW